MAALTSSAGRIERRSRVIGTGAHRVDRAVPSPSRELQHAKWALRESGRRIEVDIGTVWLPVSRGIHQRPWRTLGLFVAAGAVYGWMDDATDGAVARLTWRVLRSGVSMRVLGRR